MANINNSTFYLPLANCTEVTPRCPVEHSIYGYYPSIGANAFFVAFFAMCGALQLLFGIRYKTWTYLIAMLLACVDQSLGYIGRVILHSNPFNSVGFEIQICCLILGPAFNSAAIYLVLKHITLTFGPEYSKIKPNWYTWIFITGDLISLVIQAIGGGMAATANSNQSQQNTGDDLMMAGIAWQVVTLFFFGGAAAWYVVRRWRAHDVPFSTEATRFLNDRKFQLFVYGFIIAYVAIMIRCIYRLVEMAGGWANPVMQFEPAFIALDGCMVVIATLVQTVCHPGFCFPRLSSGYIPPRPASTVSTAPKEFQYNPSSMAPTPPAESVEIEREKDVREEA
ncbi:uncharacterized protein Z520_09199 [Fonsecaea multimorphosa CBS 102226]|uniref:RTA1 domain protein n=1 Tax=Fonsecaea multimorphosa CBS 102226 TaxID=1442371 RepID=A0A0D2JPJ5_9EURO|nr:uncharacterized protein Z520_09199 [Fonsecaea multimorphosa CBS 102226]KIX95282.1 hypothetical protein Z520_09199 [Fonsecaea multimorphosa CBS 102226]OAL17230.1 hypothetical protein AYO22_11795 [Fonsecaea multimorphosa]